MSLSKASDRNRATPREDVDVYTITYKGMDSAMFEVGKTNPTAYTVETETFTLNNPTRKGYTFAGWTGTNLDRVSKEVTIAKGTTGDITLTANWTIVTYGITPTVWATAR